MSDETTSNYYPRDMLGYGKAVPVPHWPTGFGLQGGTSNDDLTKTPKNVIAGSRARVAVQFVVNYEEGGENCILHGDKASEAFLSEIVGAPALEGVRHMNMESIYEFGSRAGFWRLHRLFVERGMPVTVFAVAMALQRNPEVVAAMKQADWEIASHGLRWIDYQFLSEEIEREHMLQAIEIHQQTTGQRPSGWYLGRCSPNSHRLVAQEGGFIYNADTYADELPYWDYQFDEPQLMMPYTLDANDMRFATAQGFNTGEQFYTYLKDSFDQLYHEGASTPKMMSIGLHCRLAGRPGRAAGLARFLDYISNFEDIWVATREQIALHWRDQFPVS